MPDIHYLCFLIPCHLPVAAAALGVGRPAPQDEADAAVGVPEHPPPPPAVAATATTAAAALPPQGIVDQDMNDGDLEVYGKGGDVEEEEEEEDGTPAARSTCRAPPLNADGKAQGQSPDEALVFGCYGCYNTLPHPLVSFSCPLQALSSAQARRSDHTSNVANRGMMEQGFIHGLRGRSTRFLWLTSLMTNRSYFLQPWLTSSWTRPPHLPSPRLLST